MDPPQIHNDQLPPDIVTAVWYDAFGPMILVGVLAAAAAVFLIWAIGRKPAE
jgi:hypothetical protein